MLKLLGVYPWNPFRLYKCQKWQLSLETTEVETYCILKKFMRFD